MHDNYPNTTKCTILHEKAGKQFYITSLDHVDLFANLAEKIAVLFERYHIIFALTQDTICFIAFCLKLHSAANSKFPIKIPN